jgi:hypothetical protein
MPGLENVRRLKRYNKSKKKYRKEKKTSVKDTAV